MDSDLAGLGLAVGVEQAPGPKVNGRREPTEPEKNTVDVPQPGMPASRRWRKITVWGAQEDLWAGAQSTPRQAALFSLQGQPTASSTGCAAGQAPNPHLRLLNPSPAKPVLLSRTLHDSSPRCGVSGGTSIHRPWRRARTQVLTSPPHHARRFAAVLPQLPNSSGGGPTTRLTSEDVSVLGPFSNGTIMSFFQFLPSRRNFGLLDVFLDFRRGQGRITRRWKRIAPDTSACLRGHVGECRRYLPWFS